MLGIELSNMSFPPKKMNFPFWGESRDDLLEKPNSKKANTIVVWLIPCMKKAFIAKMSLNKKFVHIQKKNSKAESYIN